eukprot:11407017-Prorocentrum_lima.AAC.1
MDDDVVAQLASLHHRLLVILVRASGVTHAGLRSATRPLKDRLSTRSRRMIGHVDVAYAVARHLHPASVAALVER